MGDRAAFARFLSTIAAASAGRLPSYLPRKSERLCLAVHFGLLPLAKALLDRGLLWTVYTCGPHQTATASGLLFASSVTPPPSSSPRPRDIVRLLVERGAHLEARNDKKNTPLHHAVDCGQLEAVMALVEHGADVGSARHHRHTPLEMAVRMGHSEVARWLFVYPRSPGEHKSVSMPAP
ncbi:ankyrin repeat-containing domain protein [Zopfochytrium polystomum]|nr:ankyrin repeat-containing domain protein [Zopfochytrium polystomum]